MNEKIKETLQKLKNGKIILIIGIIGILLIFLSTFSSNDKKTTVNESFNTESYKESLENELKKIVGDITNSKNISVMITLENGIRYTYADEIKESDSQKGGDTSHDDASAKEQTYRTLSDASGGEKALIISEYLPEVRGVAIVYDGITDTVLNEKISDAVTAALGITSKRVYITGNS